MEISNRTSILRDDFQEKLNLEGTGAGTVTQPPTLFWADKSSFCLLKELTLVWNDNMKQEWGDQFSNPELFPQLQVVNLKGRHGESFNLGSSFIHKVQIEKLTIAKALCEVLFQGSTVEEEVKGQPKAAAHFTLLELNDLSELIKIWEENYEHASMFKKLKSFQVFGCHKLITLLPSQVLFPSLASLVISRCNGLKTLMTMPTAQSLTQLSSMKISECDKLEEILVLVEKNDGGGINMEGVTFPKLKYLELSCLKSITSFCSGECKLSFPVLQELVVKKCPLIKSFSSSPHDDLISITPKLKTVQTETGSLLVQEGRLNKALMDFFKEQLACIETVDLSDSPMWRAQWFSTVSFSKVDPTNNSFNKLKTLIVADVDLKELPAAVPSDKAMLLGSLESLEVRDCNALSQVFETRQRKMNKMACFKNLQSITIRGCNGLKCILTTAMVLSLTPLRSMHIAKCDDLVEIVARQDDEVKDNRKELAIEFLNLETLILESLPKLERFCQLSTTTPALKFPALKRISIKKCDRMKTFTSEFLPNERARSTNIGDSNIPQESFFCDNKVHFPSLEKLNLSDMDGLRTLFPNKDGVTSINLGNLKEVVIYRCPTLKYVFPASVAASLVKLNKLNIEDCGGLEEIVAVAAANKGSENAASSNNGESRLVFPTVTVLRLKNLPELKSFYEVGVVHTSEWLSLKGLIVSGCPKVETLALDIESCKKSNLLPSEGQVQGHLLDEIQTNRPLFLISKDTFPQLRLMIINDMDSMKRIWDVVDNDRITEEVSPHEITTMPVPDGSNNMVEDGGISFTFRMLKEIFISKLPTLESFSSACCTFSFPSLKFVGILGCPDMKTFSAGNLLTPEQFEAQIRLKIAESDSDDDEVEVEGRINFDLIDRIINDDDDIDMIINNEDDARYDNVAKYCINTIIQKQSATIATQREERKREEEEGGKGLNDSKEDADEGIKDVDDNGEGDNEDDDGQLDLKTTITDQPSLQME